MEARIMRILFQNFDMLVYKLWSILPSFAHIRKSISDDNYLGKCVISFPTGLLKSLETYL